MCYVVAALKRLICLII